MAKYTETKFDKVEPPKQNKEDVKMHTLYDKDFDVTLPVQDKKVEEPKVTTKAPHLSNMVSGAEFKDEFVKELHKNHEDPSKDKKYNEVREACEFLFKVIAENCPQCADRTTALQTVRLARMWANSAIALDGVDVGA